MAKTQKTKKGTKKQGTKDMKLVAWVSHTGQNEIIVGLLKNREQLMQLYFENTGRDLDNFTEIRSESEFNDLWFVGGHADVQAGSAVED